MLFLVNQGKTFDALLTDLSKVFDCLGHERFWGKFENEVIKSFRTSLNNLKKHYDSIYRKELTRLKQSACVDVTWYFRTIFHLGYIKRNVNYS